MKQTFIAHAGELTTLPAELFDGSELLFDTRQSELGRFLNEAVTLTAMPFLVDEDADFIETAHYRRRLVLPETLDADAVYVSCRRGEVTLAWEFSAYHSAVWLRDFEKEVRNSNPQCARLFRDYMDGTDSVDCSLFVMSKENFVEGFTPFFAPFYSAAVRLLEEKKADLDRFGPYNRRQLGFLLERACGAVLAAFPYVQQVPMKVADIASPWRRRADELRTFVDGPWKGWVTT